MIRRFHTDGGAFVALAVAFIAATRPAASPEALGVAGFGALVVALLLVLPAVDPWKRLRVDEKPLPQARLVSALLAAAGALVLAGPLAGRSAQEAESLTTLVFVLFLAAMGNLFPAIRRNAYFGIRTPWTLKNDVVWERTHRLFGHLLVGMAAVLAALWPLLAPDVFASVMGAAALLYTVAAVLYSWRLARQLPPLA